MASKAFMLFLAVNLMVLGMATPGAFGLCPTTLQLGVCVDLLDLLKANVGVPPSTPCCPLLDGLTDLEAAACLCNVLNIIDISIVLNYCGKHLPSGFVCWSIIASRRPCVWINIHKRPCFPLVAWFACSCLVHVLVMDRFACSAWQRASAVIYCGFSLHHLYAFVVIKGRYSLVCRCFNEVSFAPKIQCFLFGLIILAVQESEYIYDYVRTAETDLWSLD